MNDRQSGKVMHFGGTALGLGILWFGLSSPKPGWQALCEALPEWMINSEAALCLAGLGVFLLFLGDRLTPRNRQSFAQEINKSSGGPEKISDEFSHRDPSTDKQPDVEQKKSEESEMSSKERVALRPCWPQRETSSWVGGLPKLPAKMDWPMVGTRPAVFLAQISLEDLPKALWNGVGPRSGWLVFWAGDNDTDRCAKSIVRYVTGRVEERRQRPGVTPNWHRTMVPKGLEAALGEEGKSPARWYLEQVDGPALGAVEDMMSETESYYNEDLGEWIWEPTWTSKVRDYLNQVVTQDEIRNGVDWPSLRGLIGIWHQAVLDNIHDLGRQIANADMDLERAKAPMEKELKLLRDNPGAEQISFDAIERKLAEATAKFTAGIDKAKALLRKANAALEFAEDVELEIATLEQDTPFAPELGEEILAKLNKSYAATSGHVHRDIQHFMENYARYQYTLDRDSVPDVLISLFAPLWELQCRETLIFMGRSLGSERADARLIDMPPHPLAGLTFGDNCRFYSDLRVPDLIQGNWHKASATVHYG